MSNQGLALPAIVAMVVAIGLATAVPASAQDTVLLRGAIFEDVNGDGHFGPTEPGFGGIVVDVYSDTNGNGEIDAGEPQLGSTLSFNDGFYAILGLAPGMAVARVHPPAGFFSTVGNDVAVDLIGGPVNPEAVVDYPMARSFVSASLPIADAEYRGKGVTADVLAAGDGQVVDVYDREKRFENLFLRAWDFAGNDPSTEVLSARLQTRVSISYNGGALEAQQVLPDGSVISLGTIVPPVQNEFVDVDFEYELSGIDTLADLCAAELRLTVVDPDGDRGPNEHIKIDHAAVSVELLP